MVHNVIKLCIDYLRKGAPFPQSGYDELDSTLIPPRQDHYRITPSPGGPIDRYGMFFFDLVKVLLPSSCFCSSGTDLLQDH